jgi:predicted peroxiredoxin
MIELKWESEISYENSAYKKGYTMKDLFFQCIKKFCKLYSCFTLLGTMLIVSHGRMISMFSIISQNWINHLAYESEIWQIFRNSSENHKDRSITVLFSD